jgi:hypothetical protein
MQENAARAGRDAKAQNHDEYRPTIGESLAKVKAARPHQWFGAGVIRDAEHLK